MTNEKECRWLQTEEAIESISKTHIGYLIQYKKYLIQRILFVIYRMI